MADSPKFHPALTVTNVKSLDPVTLDNEQALYHSWATLFINLAKVCDLYNHLSPPTEEMAIATYAKAKSDDLSLWKRLDAIVLQLIYSTISPDLLFAILKCNDTIEGAWNHLEAPFQDNKAYRATHLEEEFANAAFEAFNSIENYCNHLQSLADRLDDVDAPVTNGHLVLHLTGSLLEAYSGIVDYIQNQKPLSSFESCRSRLKMAKRTIKAHLARDNGTRTNGVAMVATNISPLNGLFWK